MKLLNIESSERPSVNSGSKGFLILSTTVDGKIKLFCYFEGIAKGTMSVFIKDKYIKHADIIVPFDNAKDAIEEAFKHLGNEAPIYSWFLDYAQECLKQHLLPEQLKEYMFNLVSIKHLIGEASGYGDMDNVKMQVALEIAGIENIGYEYRHTSSLTHTTIDYVLEETGVLEMLVEFLKNLRPKLL